jgi:hypothetical protein
LVSFVITFDLFLNELIDELTMKFPQQSSILCLVLLSALTLLGSRDVHAQNNSGISGINSVPNTNLILGANGNEYGYITANGGIALGTSGTTAAGTQFITVGTNGVPVGTTNSLFGMLNIDPSAGINIAAPLGIGTTKPHSILDLVPVGDGFSFGGITIEGGQSTTVNPTLSGLTGSYPTSPGINFYLPADGPLTDYGAAIGEATTVGGFVSDALPGDFGVRASLNHDVVVGSMTSLGPPPFAQATLIAKANGDILIGGINVVNWGAGPLYNTSNMVIANSGYIGIGLGTA